MMECEDEVKIKIEQSEVKFKIEDSEVIDDYDHIIENEKPAKRKRCASTRPSRKVRSSNVRMEHRRRLNRLLSRLIKQHNWKEASGVLSTLLKGTSNERSSAKNRNKYWAAMELLNKVDKKQSNLSKVKGIYEVWMRRNATKDKYPIQLEFYLYCLTHESPEVAAMAIPLLVTEKEYVSEPISNMLLGLMYYQLWYMSIPEEMKLRNFDTYESPTVSEISGMKSYFPNENSDGHNSADVHDVESIVQYDSDTSVGNNKKLYMNTDDVPQRKVTNQLSQTQGFYIEESAGMSGNEEGSFPNHGGNFTSIFHSRRLPTSLLPIRLPNFNENLEDSIHLHRELLNIDYDNAVKHLRIALYSTPPLLASLLPLIQLLVLGDQVKEALEELEKLCQCSNATLPLRLRTILLESFHSKNSTVLSTCYEDILKKDPTCSHSLTNLITMHKNGDYNLESLVEMIALHLEATSASSSVWGELASCFLKLSQFEEDQMSVNENANEGGGKQALSSMVVPKVFIQRRLGKLWKLRCRWWSMRHFSENAYLSDIQTGDMELITFKAACASHLYGPEFEYVINVETCLKNEDTKNLMSALQDHIKNSINLFENLNRAM